MGYLGKVVQALEVNGKPKTVSGPFQTQAGVEDFKKLYLKMYPDAKLMVVDASTRSRSKRGAEKPSK